MKEIGNEVCEEHRPEPKGFLRHEQFLSLSVMEQEGSEHVSDMILFKSAWAIMRRNDQKGAKILREKNFKFSSLMQARIDDDLISHHVKWQLQVVGSKGYILKKVPPR